MKTETCGKCGCKFSWDNNALFGNSPATEWFSYICPDCARENAAQDRHEEHEREAERRHQERMNDNNPDGYRSNETYAGNPGHETWGDFIVNFIVGIFSLLVVLASGFSGFFGIIFGSLGSLMVLVTGFNCFRIWNDKQRRADLQQGKIDSYIERSLGNQQRKSLVVAMVAVLVIALGALYFNKLQNEDRLRAEIDQKAVQVRQAEQREVAAAQEARQQAEAQKLERERAARAEAAAARQQQAQSVGMPANLSAEFLADFEKYKAMNDAKAIVLALEPGGRGSWSWASGFATPYEAIKSAMDSCETRRRNSGISTSCRIFAVGSVIDW